MKKTSILLLLAAATVLVSCKKDNLGADAVENDGSVISAVIDDDNNSGKTTLDGVKVLWVSGDAIAINKKQYSATPDATDARKATFTIFMASAPTDAPFCAYYPYSDNRTTSKGQFSLPTIQYYSTKSPLGSSPMYAESESLDGTFHFKNVCGLLTLDLKGEGTVSKIDVSANENLAGTLTNIAINDSGELTYGDFLSTGASKTVSLSCGSAVTLNKETARRFYIALPEGDFTGVKITVTTDLGTMDIPATKTVSIKKNNIYHLPEMTVEVIPLEFNADLSIDKCEATSPSSVDLVVSIKPEDKDVYYIPSVQSASYVSQFEDALALARADMAYWKGKGAKSLNQLINAGLAIKGDDLEDTQFDYCTPGTDYVFYVYAVDENLYVSPAIELPFKTPAFVLPPSEAVYEDYLGQWVMGNDLITISEKANGSTYNVSGFKNMSMAGSPSYNIESVEASFQDGYIVLNEQFTGVVAPIGSYGDCNFYFCGVEEGYEEYLTTYPFESDTPQTIFQGKFDDDTIIVYPGFTDYGAFGSIGISWQIQSGTSAGNGRTIASSKLANMKKYVEPVGPTPEGVWYCAEVEDYYGNVYTDWTMTITKSGAGFAIEGFDISMDEFWSQYAEYGYKVEAPVAQWDADNSTLTVASETFTGITYYDDIIWINAQTEGDIVLKFDFEAKTCTTQSMWGAYELGDESGFWSLYTPGIVFTKQDPVGAKANKCTSNTISNRLNGKKVNLNRTMPQHEIGVVTAPKMDSRKSSKKNIKF